MALVEINWRPAAKELRVFAGLLILFFGIGAWLIASRWGATGTASVVFGVAAVVGTLGLAVPRLIWPVYILWMAAVWPLGWTISHLVMAVVFYLVITPIGLIMRGCGRDPMERRFDGPARSYWKKRSQDSATRRYFRQF